MTVDNQDTFWILHKLKMSVTHVTIDKQDTVWMFTQLKMKIFGLIDIPNEGIIKVTFRDLLSKS